MEVPATYSLLILKLSFLYHNTSFFGLILVLLFACWMNNFLLLSEVKSSFPSLVVIVSRIFAFLLFKQYVYLIKNKRINVCTVFVNLYRYIFLCLFGPSKSFFFLS